ncbi:ATP-NAD kinase-like domain-containing protein [Gymnopilus junonius]|uniref:ATP-NAD kinase-like domain-containing protein n=1 Tax=Gymnopilus junonius TaxID=109634 RepID=A0A9P5TH94_GYMJU|nr:ATP-NAD kinase-like domain-containing protein [Gymnopilus junonius]
MALLAIINPACGNGDGPLFFASHVLPLLADRPLSVVHTTHTGHAQAVLAAIHPPPTLVLCSGDGTLHEILSALSPAALSFVLVPCGTANALYASLFPPSPDHDQVAYRLQSVRAFLRGAPPRPLSLASTTIAGQVALSSVVASTSLHASILHHSEALRQSHPGIERFKIAAQQNSNKWYRAHVKLVPSPTVQIYDPKSDAFVPHPQSTSHSPAVHLDGPFVYFLSTVNVDRLEPQFTISPLARRIPPPPATCDIVVLRPLRDPSTHQDTPQARLAFVPKIWQVLGGAYQDGAHVRFTYTDDGQIVTDGDGPTVIEYFRCGGWEWYPDDQDQDAHLVCADGTIFEIPKHDHAVCSIDPVPHGFSVYGNGK